MSIGPLISWGEKRSPFFGDRNVLEFAGFIEGAKPSFARTQAAIHGIERWYGLTVYRYADSPDGRIVHELHVIPPPAG